MSIVKRMNRRRFLRGAGGAIIGLPFLSVMGGDIGIARGDTPAFPTRYVTYFSPNGFASSGWPRISGDRTARALRAQSSHLGQFRDGSMGRADEEWLAAV